MDEDLKAYREHLVKAGQRSLQDYDKTLLTLSGGALGVSFAFIRDVIGDAAIVCPSLLVVAWAMWGASMACTLSSFFVAHRALRRAIRQVDADTVREQVAGGVFATLTNFLNASSGVLFLTGLVLILIFVACNL